MESRKVPSRLGSRSRGLSTDAGGLLSPAAYPYIRSKGVTTTGRRPFSTTTAGVKGSSKNPGRLLPQMRQYRYYLEPVGEPMEQRGFFDICD